MLSYILFSSIHNLYSAPKLRGHYHTNKNIRTLFILLFMYAEKYSITICILYVSIVENQC
jgi:hypothetical protein